MDSGSAGLFSILKDKCRSWPDKLKIAEDAWGSPAVFIPNKKQALVDWLVGVLLNRRKNQLDKETRRLAWQCLGFFLSSSCKGDKHEGQSELRLKPNLLQVACEEMGADPEDDKSVVCQCCYIIVSSSSLSEVLFLNFCSLVKLTGACCALVNSEVNSSVAFPVLKVLASKMQKALRQQANIRLAAQLLVEHLLPAAICVLGKHSSGDRAEVCSMLGKCICDVLFHREHLSAYGAALPIMLSYNDKQSLPIKFIGDVFGLFSQALSSREYISQQACLDYLPQYFSAFLEAKHEDQTAPFAMLQYLCHLLTLKRDRVGGVGVNVPPLASTITCCSNLLGAAAKHDIYNLAQDMSLGSKRLAWLRAMAATILGHGDSQSSQPSWYKCLNCLLSISHSVIEPHLVELWKQAWFHSMPLGEDQRSQDELFCNLFGTYEKLRQLPKFIEGFLAAMNQAEGVHPRFSHAFLSRFAAAIQAAPTVCVLEMWDRLTAFMEENIKIGGNTVEELDSMSGHAAVAPFKVELVAELLYWLTRSIRLFDPTATKASREGAKVLMVRMLQRIVQPVLAYINQTPDQVSVLFATSLCLLGWVDLSVLFCTHDCDVTDETHSEAPFEPRATLMTGLLSVDNLVDEINKLVLKGVPASRLMFLEVELRLQKVRCVLYTCDDSDQQVQSNVCHDVSSVLEQLTDIGSDSLGCWDGRISSVGSCNCGTAIFKAIISCLPLCAHYVTEKSHWENMSRLICGSPSAGDGESMDATKQEWALLTVETVTDKLLKSAVFPELKAMHIHIVTAMLAESAKCAAYPIRKSKSSKLTVSDCSLEIVLNSLLEDNYLAGLRHDSKVLPKAAEKWLNKVDRLMHSIILPKKGAAAFLSMLERHAKIMTALPLEHADGRITACCLTYSIIILRLWTAAATDSSRAVGDEPVHGSLLKHHASSLLPRILESLARLLSANHYSKLLLPHLDVCEVASVLARTNFLVHKETPLHDLLPAFVKTCCAPESFTTGPPAPCALLDQQAKFLDELCTVSGVKEPAAELVILDVLLLRVSKVLRKFSADASSKQPWSTLLQERNQALQDKIVGAMHFDKLPAQLSAVLLNCYSTMLYDGHAHSTNLLTAVTRKCLTELLCSQDPGWLVASLRFIALIAEKYHDLLTVVEQDLGLQTWPRLCQLHSMVVLTTYDGTLSAVTPLAEAEDRRTAWHHLDFKDVVHELKLALFRVPVVDRQLHTVLQDHITKMVPHADLCQLRATVATWEVLLECQLTGELQKMLSFAAQALLIAVQNVAAWMGDSTKWSESTVDRALTAASLCDLTSKIIEHDPPLLYKSQHTSACLLGAAPLEDMLLLPELQPLQFEVLFAALHRVLNALLMWHASHVYGWVPLYVAHCTKLLTAVVSRSDQDALGRMTNREVDAMVNCAQLVTRLFTLLSTHKADFNKVAPYVVASYISCMQKVTILPEIKKCLLLGIYKLVDICDEHSIALLHTALEAASKEIFKKLYDDYKHHHKYSGRV